MYQKIFSLLTVRLYLLLQDFFSDHSSQETMSASFCEVSSALGHMLVKLSGTSLYGTAV